MAVLYTNDISWSYCTSSLVSVPIKPSVSVFAEVQLQQHALKILYFNNQDLEGCGSSCSTGNSSLSVEFELELAPQQLCSGLVIAVNTHTSHCSRTTVCIQYSVYLTGFTK